MRFKLETINMMAAALESLRLKDDEKDKFDTNFKKRLSGDFLKDNPDLKLPHPDAGLSIDRIGDILEAQKRSKPSLAEKVHIKFIENLSYVSGMGLDQMFKHEDYIKFIPSYVEELTVGIKKQLNQRLLFEEESILIESDELQLFILRLNPGRMSPHKDLVIERIEEIDHDYLKRVFIKSSNGNQDPTFIKAFIQEKENRFRRYSRKLKRETKGKVKITLSFLDDRDLSAPYNLFILKSIKEDKIIYSARTFSGFDDIEKELIGEESNTDHDPYDIMMHDQVLKFSGLVSKKLGTRCFVIDRFAGSSRSELGLMANYGKVILYSTILRFHLKKNEDHIICLARREYSNSLLTEYIKLGLKIVGINYYTIGNEELSHWVLYGKVNELILEAESLGYLKNFIADCIKT